MSFQQRFADCKKKLWWKWDWISINFKYICFGSLRRLRVECFWLIWCKSLCVKRLYSKTFWRSLTLGYCCSIIPFKLNFIFIYFFSDYQEPIPNVFQKYWKYFQLLECFGYRVAHVEANTADINLYKLNGSLKSHCYEMLFIRRELI